MSESADANTENIKYFDYFFNNIMPSKLHILQQGELYVPT